MLSFFKKYGKKMMLPVLTLLLITGCAKQTAPSEDKLVQGDMGNESKNLITVGFAQVGSESDWRNASTKSFRETFTEENGYYLLFEDAQQKQENQLKAVRNFILQEVDYIVLSPIVETGWETVLEEVKQAGIPLILADRSVDIADTSLYTCYVGSDFDLAGEKAGRWLDDYLKSKGRDQETIHIVTLQGTPGSSAQLGRTDGFGLVLEEHPNWVMLKMQSGDFTQAKGQEVMENFLDTYEDIDVVICENDNMAFGAIDAIHEAGRTCGPNGDMIVISFDATRAALQAMIDGKMNATFECNPLLGPRVSEIIQCLEQGREVEKIQHVEETYFDCSMDLEEMIEKRMY